MHDCFCNLTPVLKLPESLHSMLHCILKCEQFVNDPKNHIYSTSLLKAVEEDCQKLLNTMEGCENCSEATVSQPLQSDAIILQFCLPGFEGVFSNDKLRFHRSLCYKI